ncbi:MAG: DUF6569 family protein [Melioribacteraceae bacterium]
MDFISSYFQNHKDLSVLQFETRNANLLNCISFKEAQKKSLIFISEFDDLYNLIITNTSTKYVLIINGEFLFGSKLTGIVNRSILISPNSKTILPVTYVNENILGYNLEESIGDNSFIPFNIRSEISIKVSKVLKNLKPVKSIQRVVWGKPIISQGNNQELYSTNSFVKNNSANLNSKVFSYTLDWRANSMAMFKNNRLLSIDIFHNKQIFKDNYHKVIRGSLFDTQQIKLSNNKMSQEEAIIKTKHILTMLTKSKYFTYDSFGVGTEIRSNYKNVTFSELNYKNHLIHLGALVSPNYLFR